MMGLLRAAALKGVAGAQNRLAHVYAVGIKGVDKSNFEAAKWRYIAKASGIDDKALDKVIAAFPKSVRVKAQQAAQTMTERRRAGLLGN